MLRKLMLLLVLSFGLTACGSPEEEFIWDQAQDESTESIDSEETKEVANHDDTAENKDTNSDEVETSSSKELTNDDLAEMNDYWTDQTCIEATRNLHANLGYKNSIAVSYAVMDQGNGTYVAEVFRFDSEPGMWAYRFDVDGNYEEIEMDRSVTRSGTQCYSGQPYGYSRFVSLVDSEATEELYDEFYFNVPDQIQQQQCLEYIEIFNNQDFEGYGPYVKFYLNPMVFGEMENSESIVFTSSEKEEATRNGLFQSFDGEDFFEVPSTGSMSRPICAQGKYKE